MSGGLWIAICVLLGMLILEMYYPKEVMEGFQMVEFKQKSAVPASNVTSLDEPPNTLISTFEKRGDIGPRKEEGGYKNDGRFFSGWMDVQRIGDRRDYCRMVFPDGGKEEESFFACALAGTTGITSISYRTASVKDGFKRSRDDYINHIRGDGRDAYCRILKQQDTTYKAVCVAADDRKFGTSDFIDTDPPEDIKTLLDFYRGCRMWLRFRDDMIDYMGTTVITTAGGLKVLEIPRPTITRGLQFNGKDQYLRIGDSKDLTLGNVGSLRSVRAFSVWVKFDEFTNNAHIFDFGNGEGKDNVFLGILGSGDADSSAGNEVRSGPKCQDTTVPAPKSGAQWCPEVRAQDLFELSKANVEEYKCPGPEIVADSERAKQINTRPPPEDPNAPKSRATLLYEVWDGRIRKMQIKLNRAFPKGQWTHVVITAKNMDAMRPDILVYINGSLFYTQESGVLPQNAVTDHNYIGKSNWSDAAGEYELRDELFSGSIFDFRMYNKALSETQIKRSLQWGMEYLGLSV
jgi:Concanavalin A-like lectin/glucanases superfamily